MVRRMPKIYWWIWSVGWKIKTLWGEEVFWPDEQYDLDQVCHELEDFFNSHGGYDILRFVWDRHYKAYESREEFFDEMFGVQAYVPSGRDIWVLPFPTWDHPGYCPSYEIIYDCGNKTSVYVNLCTYQYGWIAVNYYIFRHIIAHEIGHWLGLDHCWDPNCIMSYINVWAFDLGMTWPWEHYHRRQVREAYEALKETCNPY